MKKFLVLLSAILIVTSVCFAQENMGARPIAMGGAFTGLADDANAIFLNPAGIGYIEGEVAAISTKISEGSEYTILGGVENTPYGSFGVGYISSSYIIEDLETSSELVDAGDASNKNLNQTLVLSYGRQLNDFMVVPKFMGRLSLGTNVKFVSSKINNAKGLTSRSDSGLDLDLAAVFQPNDHISCGMSVRNILAAGSALEDSSEPSSPTMSAGIAGRLLNDSLIISLETGAAGVEVKLMPELALRVGRDGDYTTGGIGVSLNGVGIDYAYLKKAEPVHYIAISLAFDNPTDTRQASIIKE
ncbi:MAG: hypothetical protein JW782_02915 [Candidatus Saganbacteria bacterium]|nr:hypothetical protein [Candidatus Saganbacteria bacterium]